MIDLSRGAVVLFAQRGDYTSKPRPGIVIQHEATLADAPSITLCGVTTAIVPSNRARVPVLPSTDNGLVEPSWLMADKIVSVRRERISRVIGRLDREHLDLLDIALRRWLDL